MSEEKKQADVRWKGCGCKQCKLNGEILRKIEVVLQEGADALRENYDEQHSGGLVLDVLDSFVNMLDSIEKNSLNGLLNARAMAFMMQTYTESQFRAVQTSKIVQHEVKKVLGRMFMPIGSVHVEPGARPPGMPPFDDGGSKGGSGGYGPH